MKTLERLGWPMAGIALAAAVAASPVFDRVDQAWQDFTLRQLAQPERAQSTIVLDIDDASLHRLRDPHGEWPLPRALHADVANRLLNAGARAVVFNLMFEDARAGDAQLKEVAERSARVVFGAGAGRPGSDIVTTGSERVGWPDRPDLPAAPADRVRLPDAGLWSDSPPPWIGLVSVRWAEDGVLRCLPLLHRTRGRILPSLPLAALDLDRAGPVSAGGFIRGPAVAVGEHRWPTDASGCVALRLPANADAVPALPYSAFTKDDRAPALDAQVAGRTVFVGSPSLMDLRVMTPVGQIGGTQWLALAHEALRAGWWMSPTPHWQSPLWFGLALVPALLGALRAAPRPGVDLALGGALLALLSVAAWTLQWGLSQFVPLPALALVLACGALASGWRWQRWMTVERHRIRAEKAAADSANQAKSAFLAQVSHEIRTPLNAVLGMAQLLAETPLTAQQRRYVEVFASAGRHLQQLIEDMLDLSRVEAGRLDLSEEGFDLRFQVEELGALFGARAQSRALEFQTTIDDRVPRFVRGDARRLRQILVNLLGNALKFTHQGAVNLAVAPVNGGSLLEFVVKDSGVGIAPSRQRAVFEPFTQADGRVAREFGGTGLGLAISRQLIEAMHGSVDLISTPGLGTEVRFRLPLPACVAPAPEVPQTAADQAWHGRKVLLAEDHPHNVLVVEGLLAGTGLSLDIAIDGAQAVRMAAATAYDLILMDIQMPTLDGLAATRQIRLAERAAGVQAVPILALSANAMPGDAQASLAAGCDAHLAKPLDKQVLLGALGAHLGPGVASPAPPLSTAAAPELDLDRVLRRLGGDQALLAKVCTAALAQLTAWEARYDGAAGDLMTRRRLAHDLKSIAGTVGATALQQAAAELESQSAGNDSNGPALDESLRLALQRTCMRLASL